VKANVLFFDKKPASETPWTRKLWIYDLRTNMHFTLKTNPLKREDLEEFVQCYNPTNRHQRMVTRAEQSNPDGRSRAYDYEDLQREVSRRLDRKGNVLYELVKARFPDTYEIVFVDGVQQSLARGRFLLLIVGDGIKKGAGAIAEFLESVGSLESTFGLVELALYRHDDFGLLVQPRVIARTVEFRRNIVVLPEGAKLENGAEPDALLSKEANELQAFYRNFWAEFLRQLQLDDVSQPLANITQIQNIYFMLPPSGGSVWVSAFFAKSKETVGVYMRAAKGSVGDSVSAYLEADRDQIKCDLGDDALFPDVAGHYSPIISRRFDDIHSAENRDGIKAFLADGVNRFINAFRPRLKRFIEEQA
jgi:hypothetical protein